MNSIFTTLWALCVLCGLSFAAENSPPLVQPRQPDGDGKGAVSGELKQWPNVTLTFDGPFAHERDSEPNPITDVRLNVTSSITLKGKIELQEGTG